MIDDPFAIGAPRAHCPLPVFNLRRYLVLTAAHARADQWVKPTPEELQMTAEPAAPGASAIYLYREERADDKTHFDTTYVRLKVLDEKGRLPPSRAKSPSAGTLSRRSRA